MVTSTCCGYQLFKSSSTCTCQAQHEKQTGRRCKGSKACEQHKSSMVLCQVLCEQMVQFDAQHGSASNVLLDISYRDAEDMP